MSTRTHVGAVLLALGACLMNACDASNTGSGALSTPAAPSPSNSGSTVQVAVSAADPDGDQLHYQWRAIEGQVQNVDAPSTQWTLPPGKGLQFLYVLVSDRKGGYRESRVAVLSGTDRVVSLTAPFAPTAGSTTRATLYGATVCSAFDAANCPSPNRSLYMPNISVRLSGSGGNPTLSATTDFKGEFFFQNIPPGSYNLQYSLDGVTFVASSTVSINANSNALRREVHIGSALSGMTEVAGHVHLHDPAAGDVRDAPLCGTSNHFFGGGDITATAELLDAVNAHLAGPVPVNAFGDFLLFIPSGLTNARVRIVCETTSVVSPGFSLAAGGKRVLNPIQIQNQRPVITSMTATHNGNRVERPDFPQATTMLPEMAASLDDGAFLTQKGLDTRLSACRYYQTIGAVEGCDTAGTPTGRQLTFDSWKQQHGLAPYDSGNPEIATLYINRADLDIVRDMHGVKRGPGHLAYYTCNYPGPQNVTSSDGAPSRIGSETQADIDLAFANAQRGIGLLACVAMDYSIVTGANNNQPFTKFYTFGPSGNLQLSVSLDGRREKFMPGSCTACHGGDFYRGRYADDGSGLANIGSKWLPFDMANFDFSTTQKQNMAGINAAMKQFNQLMVSADVSSITRDRTKELINGWYAGGRLDQDPQFVPNLWNYDSTGVDLYRKVAQHSCQTCHTGQLVDEFISSDFVCGGFASLASNHRMPNALVAFERFWLSGNQSRPGYDVNLDQPGLMGCSGTPARHPAL